MPMKSDLEIKIELLNLLSQISPEMRENPDGEKEAMSWAYFDGVVAGYLNVLTGTPRPELNYESPGEILYAAGIPYEYNPDGTIEVKLEGVEEVCGTFGEIQGHG